MKRTRVHQSIFSLVLAVIVFSAGFLTRNLPQTVQRTGAESLAQSTQTVSYLFPQTKQTVRGKFLQYWIVNGGLPQQGYPISSEMAETSDTDGKTYTVQYFERAVFEYHPENQPPHDVLLSLLGNFRYKQKYRQAGGAPGQTPNTSTGSRLFPETGKRVGGKFLDYWNKNGGLAQQGYPVSDEFTETSDLNGRQYTVQYFERAVFEYHPENQLPYDVLLSQLGTFRYRNQYVGAGARPVKPPAVPVPSAGWEQAQVLSVIDGDTIMVSRGEKPAPVGYLLVEAPECYATEAKKANESLVAGKTVYLEKDVSEADSCSLVRYVFNLDALVLVNAELVKGGFARVVNSPPNTRYKARLDLLQSYAMNERRGLWALNCPASPSPSPGGCAGVPTSVAASATAIPPMVPTIRNTPVLPPPTRTFTPVGTSAAATSTRTPVGTSPTNPPASPSPPSPAPPTVTPPTPPMVPTIRNTQVVAPPTPTVTPTPPTLPTPPTPPMVPTIPNTQVPAPTYTVGPSSTPVPTCTPEPTETPTKDKKIKICHATGSETNPYVEIEISESAIPAHRHHQWGEDIIPAPAEGCP